MKVREKKETKSVVKNKKGIKIFLNKDFFKKGIAKSGITIRTQLIIGFVIPIIFIMVVGIVSYQKAARGLESNYEQSTTNALEMTRNSLDSSLQIINQQVMELGRNISVKETSSDIIQNVHIIPVDKEVVVTSKTLSAAEIDSFMAGLKESEDSELLENSYVKWGENHPYIDSQMEIGTDEYTLFCSQAVNSGGSKALIVFDISTQGIRELLQQLDFGENSHVAFVTANGREVNSGEAISVFETDFFQEGKSSGEERFTEYVKYDNKNYFFMMCKSQVVDGYITVLVPKENIVKSSVQIRNITVILVALSAVVAIVLGCYITAGISINIRKSEKSLKRVSQGELFLPSKNERFPKNEFGRLHSAIRNTIDKMRALVLEVIKMIGVVSDSGHKVNESGKQVSIYVQNMNEQMKQVEAAEILTVEAGNMKENMKTLEATVETFKVEEN